MRNEKGFTLIELLVVILIIGILLALVIPNFALFQERARRASVKDNMHVIQTSIEAYATDHYGAYPIMDEWVADAGIAFYWPGGDIFAVPDPLYGGAPINPYSAARYDMEANLLYNGGDFGPFEYSGQAAAVYGDDEQVDCPYLDWVISMSGGDDPTYQGAIVVGCYPDAEGGSAPSEYGIAGWGRMYADGEDHWCMYDLGPISDPTDNSTWTYYVLHN